MKQLFVLFEHASGYGLFKVKQFEEIGAFLPQVEEAVVDSAKFRTIVQLVGYKPFTSAASALENINAVSEGLVTSDLSAFLETNLPSMGKDSKIQLGVVEAKLAAAVNEKFALSVTHVGVVPEIVRGIRQHLTTYVKGLSPASMKQTELGLGHAYSRGKVKFNVNRADNMIIQSISILDQLDKDINTFAMRMREWYSYHFPELARIVTDNYQYSLCADAIKDRKTLSEDSLERLEEIVMDPAKAQAILDGSRMSMGMDISPIDLMNIERFAKRVISLSQYRKELAEYLKNKMALIAPNLACLIGEVVGARLISHTGSLTNLAKCPASTVQILGAEKALFRAIKTKSNTPKYGLIYHSSFISRAGPTNKGRISRYLANKCSIATRIDCFSENLTSIFGERLRGQVEDRLKFYEKGDIPRKNAEVMSEALRDHNDAVKVQAEKRKYDINGDGEVGDADVPKKKKKKKNKHREQEQEEVAEETTVSTPGEKKKKKKQAHEETFEMNGEAASAPEESVPETTPKKKKKKKSLEPGLADVSMDQEAAETSVQINSDGSAKKKKKKKSLLPEEAMDTSMTAEPVQVNGEGSAKKKKKKKSLLPEEAVAEAAVEQMDVSGEGSSKKKKKKKSIQPGEEVGFVLDLNGDLEPEQGASEESPKKKKKKKKNRESLEAAE